MKYYKNLSIDESNCTVKKEGQPIHLTAMEYQLFVTLLDYSGCVCSRNLLLSSAWHITAPIQTRTVDVHKLHISLTSSFLNLLYHVALSITISFPLLRDYLSVYDL